MRVFLLVSVDKIWNKAADVEDKGLLCIKLFFKFLLLLMGFEHWAVGFRKKWLGNEIVAFH